MKFILKTLKLLPILFIALALTGCSDDDDSSSPSECSADAGTLTAIASPVTLSDGSATIGATPAGDISVPTDYETTYVLTSGANLVIIGTATTPSFTVTETGVYTIHTLVAETSDSNDPNFLDLSIVVPGTTTGGDVAGLIADADICADLDVTGASIEVIASIVDIADSVGLTILSDALELSGLDEAVDGFLRNGDEFTVFAPTDDAFIALLNSNPDWNSLDDIPEGTLNAVLLYHVLGVTRDAQFFVGAGDGYAPTLSANGPEGTNLSVYFRFADGAVQLNGGNIAAKGANVSNADTNIGNGIIHIIDGVLLLPTIADFADANPGLEILVDAMEYADTGMNPINWINTVSNPDVTLTVFAPVNDAFVELLGDLGVGSLNEIAPETVSSVLSLHVINEANILSTGLPSEPTEVGTIGGDITINGTVITDGDGNAINILAPSLVDIQAVNGVVHAIDFVIRAAVEN